MSIYPMSYVMGCGEYRNTTLENRIVSTYDEFNRSNRELDIEIVGLPLVAGAEDGWASDSEDVDLLVGLRVALDGVMTPEKNVWLDNYLSLDISEGVRDESTTALHEPEDSTTAIVMLVMLSLYVFNVGE